MSFMIQDILPHKLNNHFVPGRRPEPGDAVFCFRDRAYALRRTEGEAFSLPSVADLPPGQRLTYLFDVDGRAHFLLDEPSDGVAAELDAKGFSFYTNGELRQLFAGPKEVIFAGFTAVQLAAWYRDNRYCGRCGCVTMPGNEERSLICPSCGRVIYPRIIPAVIVGVTNGDEILLTKYERHRGIPYYALVAGFTEIGETFEGTVEREVMEETGLRVKNIRYFASQPWGIADDLLAGFYCDVDGDPTITMDASELSEAIWVKRGEITGQPDDYSLTHCMMMTFNEGREPK